MRKPFLVVKSLISKETKKAIIPHETILLQCLNSSLFTFQEMILTAKRGCIPLYSRKIMSEYRM